MPLIHSKSDKAFKQNVSTLMGEVGKSPHVQSREQALAIAYSTKRRGRQMGGTAPWYVRNEARGLTHTGPINSAVPGRTDRHNINVPSGSYVMPAQAVSHLGQSNTMAGMKVLGGMFKQSPYGGGPTMGIPHGHLPAPPHLPKMGGMGMSDRGGSRGEHEDGSVPVVVAGGEFIISPADVRMIGGGDIKKGHRILDAWVKHIQKEHAKTIAKLPAPVKS